MEDLAPLAEEGTNVAAGVDRALEHVRSARVGV
jgi:hypothetical protein